MRTYARAAALAFALITAYSVTTKLAGGTLAEDWVHSALHVLSGAVAVHAGWVSRSVRPAWWFTGAVGVGYTALGVLGWFVPGFFLHSPAALPLDPAANVFHLALGSSALAVLVLGRRDRPVTN